MSRPCSNETEDPGCWIMGFMILGLICLVGYQYIKWCMK